MSGAILDRAAALHPALAGDNEYLRRALSEGELQVGWHVRWPGSDAEMQAAIGPAMRLSARWELVREYAWAIPNDLALDALADLGPLVEVGAGGGYWAHCLRQRDVDVVAYDPRLWHETEYAVERDQGMWTEVLDEDHSAAAKHPDRALLLCWPSYNLPWAAEALSLYRGRTVAYVGEPAGGCTADDTFHDLLEREFEVAKEINIPQWFGLHDYLSIWRRP